MSEYSRARTDTLEPARPDLLAGAFSGWLRQTRQAQVRQREADVPCGGCTACCRSYQFVHVGPDEAETLAHIPADLLFPAPGLPDGHKVMGYDEQGRCPMLRDAGCSIYAHRPRTCRTYDCRVFTAAGLAPEGEAKAAIADRVQRWRFSYTTAQDQAAHTAVRAAAQFLRTHATLFPEGTIPSNPTQLAILAVKVYDVFLARPNASVPDTLVATRATAEAVLVALQRFEAGLSLEAPEE